MTSGANSRRSIHPRLAFANNSRYEGKLLTEKERAWPPVESILQLRDISLQHAGRRIVDRISFADTGRDRRQSRPLFDRARRLSVGRLQRCYSLSARVVIAA